MARSIEQSLILRMLLSLVLLVMAICGFIAAIWSVFVGFFLLGRIPLSTAMLISIVPTGVIFLWLVVLEYRGVTTIKQAATATPVTSREYPDLHATVNRVSSLLDVPAPSILISNNSAPEAMVIGVRSTKSRLILSKGTLEALDEDELEAVVAHELAHVSNRDATVMTIVSIPTVLATRLATRAPDLSQKHVPVAFVLMAVGRAGIPITKLITSACSRTRELAADRAAVKVLGSGAPLASALRTLDQQIQETPSQDLRDVQAVSSLSILPFESYEEKVRLAYWEEIDTEPFLWSVRKPLSRLSRTHPSTEKRIELILSYDNIKDKN